MYNLVNIMSDGRGNKMVDRISFYIKYALESFIALLSKMIMFQPKLRQCTLFIDLIFMGHGPLPGIGVQTLSKYIYG